MESSPISTLQAEQQQPPVPAEQMLQQILSLGMYRPIDELLEDYPYAVVFVDRWFDDIFVVVENCLIGDFNLLRLPQTYHESFTRFLDVIRSSDVQNLFIEYLGSAEGQPLLRAYGGRFCTYLC